MIKKIVMENLMCTSCTSKIEIELKSLLYVNNASFNFNTQTMLLDVTVEYVESVEIGRDGFPRGSH